MAINDFISYVESEFYVNKKEVDDVEFSSSITKGIQKLQSTAPVDVTFDKNGEIVTISLFKERGSSKLNEIRKLLNSYIDLNYDKYEAEIDNTSVFVSCISYVSDVEETILNAEQQEVSDVVSSFTKPDVEDVEELESTLLPTLSNKAYISFEKTCEAVDEFLYDYQGVAHLWRETIKQSDLNKVASAIIAPVQCWDKLGGAIKMTKEDFLMLKRNLVRLSISDRCLALAWNSTGGWENIFDRLQKYKLPNTKITRKGLDQFLTKTKVDVIDKNTKEVLGTATLIFSCIVRSVLNRTPENMIGNFVKMKSNISYDLVVK